MFARWDVAEELHRQVEILRFHPFHVASSSFGRRAAQQSDQFARPTANRRIDLDGDKGADGVFHGRDQIRCGSRGRVGCLAVADTAMV